MKTRFALIAILVLLAFSMAGAEGRGCKYCGMDLDKFAHTAMTIEYSDGTVVETCSVHCASIDMAVNIDKEPKSIKVGDFNTKKPIDAETAFWVVDDKNTGVMTARAKWAFETKDAAEGYIKAKGGALVTFDDAMKAAYEDMYNDTKMIREKRKARRMGQQHGGMQMQH